MFRAGPLVIRCTGKGVNSLQKQRLSLFGVTGQRKLIWTVYADASRPAPAVRLNGLRTLSDSSNKQQSSKAKPESEAGAESTEIALTPGEKVVAGTRLGIWAGVAVFASFCAYYIGKELIPTKMSPNSVMDVATEKIRAHPEVTRRFGSPVKVYGRDHGGHREGRRNFIEHTDYTSEDDGTKRTRVRFNLEGPYGGAFVFAEVSKDMPSGELVYVIVQDKSNGRVINVVDNRSRLMAQRLAGGNKDGQKALSDLLGKRS